MTDPMTDPITDPERPGLDPAGLDAARRWVLQWQHDRQVPGVALIVTDREQTQLLEVFGLADRAGQRGATLDQRWQIGSISKAFTSIAVLQLARSGRLAVDDAVAGHLPWVSPELDRDVTLHHLMTHTAGLPSGSEWVPDSLLESAVQGTVGRPQPPGYRFYYSNPGYELLGDVVEQVVGVRLEQHLEAAVLGPLGMTGACGSVVAEDHDRDVRGHRPPHDDQLWRGQCEQAPDAFYPTCTADGAIAATPADMAQYLRFLLRGSAEGVIGADDFARLAARHVEADEGWYGYGLHTYEKDGRVTFGHSGGMVGMFADVRVDPVAGIGTCMLINGSGDVWHANGYVLDRLCGLDPQEPTWPLPDPRDDGSLGPEYDRFIGLYRTYNPWGPTLRVIGKGGHLHLADPVDGNTTALHREGDTVFRVEHPDSPDVVDFGVRVHDRYQRLTVSGCVYGRARRQ